MATSRTCDWRHATLLPFAVPAMRKDFLVDRYQVLEARSHGACGVLLIVRMVPLAQLVAMLDCAADLGLVRAARGVRRRGLAVARRAGRNRAAAANEQVLMGLNCRDLETLQIRFRTFRVACANRCRSAWPSVAESGVTSPEDAAAVAELGYRLALVGTSSDAASGSGGGIARADRGRARGRHVSAVEKTSTLWVKVCGLSTVAAIDAAVAAGVQAVGFVFHEPSPRNLCDHCRDEPAGRGAGRNRTRCRVPASGDRNSSMR